MVSKWNIFVGKWSKITALQNMVETTALQNMVETTLPDGLETFG